MHKTTDRPVIHSSQLGQHLPEHVFGSGRIFRFTLSGCLSKPGQDVCRSYEAIVSHWGWPGVVSEKRWQRS